MLCKKPLAAASEDAMAPHPRARVEAWKNGPLNGRTATSRISEFLESPFGEHKKLMMVPGRGPKYAANECRGASGAKGGSRRFLAAVGSEPVAKSGATPKIYGNAGPAAKCQKGCGDAACSWQSSRDDAQPRRDASAP